MHSNEKLYHIPSGSCSTPGSCGCDTSHLNRRNCLWSEVWKCYIVYCEPTEQYALDSLLSCIQMKEQQIIRWNGKLGRHSGVTKYCKWRKIDEIKVWKILHATVFLANTIFTNCLTFIISLIILDEFTK